MKIEKMFLGLNISARGLTAQRTKMNAIAENIANAETTRTEQGGAYRRKFVRLQQGEKTEFSIGLKTAEVSMLQTDAAHIRGKSIQSGPGSFAVQSLEALEEDDPTPLRTVYAPGHPDADEEGYVEMPNVNVVTEMVDMIAASRAFEANITAINATKAMAKDSLEI